MSKWKRNYSVMKILSFIVKGLSFNPENWVFLTDFICIESFIIWNLFCLIFLVYSRNYIHLVKQVFLNMPHNPSLEYSFSNHYVFYWLKNLYPFQNIILDLRQSLRRLHFWCFLLHTDQLTFLNSCFKH